MTRHPKIADTRPRQLGSGPPPARRLRRFCSTWRLKTATLGSLVLAVGVLGFGVAPPAHAQLDDVCALKTAAVLAGDPTPNLDVADMPAFVDAQLSSDKFRQLFASFINTRFNRGLAMTAEEDAVFYVVKHVLDEQLPWSDVYLGAYGWGGPFGYPTVLPDPNGIGNFTAPSWVKRYAGNDLDGAMLFAAYRVVQNTTGIVLIPSPFNADANSNLQGRQRGECRYCHFDSPLALDKIANFFPTRTGFGNQMTLSPPQNAPQDLLNGRSVSSLRELLGALLSTDDYKFWTCRLVFEYTYGRAESACEAVVFDQCVAALEGTDDITRAIAAVVADPSYCSMLEVP